MLCSSISLTRDIKISGERKLVALIETEFSVSFAPEALALTPMPDLRCLHVCSSPPGWSFPASKHP